MALIFKVVKIEKFSWGRWYEKNRARLSAKRAALYKNDPAYRAKARARSRRRATWNPKSDI